MLKVIGVKRLMLSLSLVILLVAMSMTSIDAADEATINALKEKLVIANKILDAEGLARPMGHVSVRIPGTETFLISRSIAPGMVDGPDDIVICDLNGKVIRGKDRTYGEVQGHAAVYRKRKDINSVAHTHSAHVIALTMTGNTLLMASSQAMKAGYKAPIGFFKKTIQLEKPEICEEVADMIGPNNVVILRAHGALIVGNTVEECMVNACDLEIAAKYQILASSAGKLVLLTKEDMDMLIPFKEVSAKQGGDWQSIGTASSTGRAWEYYKSKVKK